MARKRDQANPLAVAVLVLLFERPMHPYEIAATLRIRHTGESIKIPYGSLYTVIETLQRESLIAVKETVREGRRPERTIYEITPVGLERMRQWLREMLGTPVKEHPRFESALSLMPAIPPVEAVELLEGRLRRFDEMCEELRATIHAAATVVDSLFLVEREYHLALVEAERQFIDNLLKRIAEDQGYIQNWKSLHLNPEPNPDSDLRS